MADRTFQDPSRAFLSVMDPAYREPSRAALMLRGLLANILSPIDLSIETYNMMRGDGGRTRTATERVAPAMGLPTPREFTPDQAAMEFGSAVGDVSPLFMMGLAGAAPSAGTRAIPNQRGAIDVSHGSPHTFDRFDFSKIGTGEGAQSYGYGGYVAEGFNSPVAQGYKKSTSYQDSVRQFRSELPDDADFDELLDLANSGSMTPQNARVIKELADNDWLGFDYPSQAITAAFREGDNFDMSPGLKAAINDYGNLYNARMAWPDATREAADPLGPQHFLDWDKPLSEQSPQIRAAINGIVDSEELYKGKYAPRFLDKRTTGGEAIEIFNSALGGPSVTSSYLREFGIPGIRYLDGNSRNAGFGSSNFVVFPGNEDMLTILERNGISLLNPQK